MAETVIRVKNLSKRYRIGEKEERKDTFAGQIGHIITAPVRNFRNLKSLVTFKENESNVHWALRDINFEVDRGEVLGIIGHNGAGKSTLLKILSSITPPTSGEIEMTGRVSSLLEIGTGFHPELSGRENVYMNGTILGMSKNEIDHKMDEIIDFSGVEKYIDTPVKFYSSGMKVRLGFSVAAHLEPEILIIDEVLAVGDAEFQKKCIGKMERVAGEGRTVLFVSHQMGAVLNLCSRSILLKNGRVFFGGTTKETVGLYLSNESEMIDWSSRNNNDKNVYFTNCELVPEKPSTYSKFDVVLTLFSKENLEVSIAVNFEDELGNKLIQYFSSNINQVLALKKGTNKVKCTVENLLMAEGRYYINLWVGYRNVEYDFLKKSMLVNILAGRYNEQSQLTSFRGYPLVPPAQWTILC